MLFVAAVCISALDATGGILSYKERAWMGLVLAVIFVPLDLSSVRAVALYNLNQFPSPNDKVEQV